MGQQKVLSEVKAGGVCSHLFHSFQRPLREVVRCLVVDVMADDDEVGRVAGGHVYRCELLVDVVF
jgi:hypothetical protein